MNKPIKNKDSSAKSKVAELVSKVSFDIYSAESIIKEIETDIKGVSNEKLMLLFRSYENESHVALMESFDEKYRQTVRKLTDDMIKEYTCRTDIEKSLAGLAVNSYMRILDNSNRLNNMLNVKEISKAKNTYIENLSKQIDRSYRQYMQSILTLQQIKSPSLKVSIKTDTAFISNNQQINTNIENNALK